MINCFDKILDRGRLFLMVSCALLLLATNPAVAGWKEANAALQSGKLAEALPHLRPLAEAGDPEAQYMLGYLLSGATGVKHDLTEAFKWYSTALALGQANAAAARTMIGKKLGQYKAAEALRQAQYWLKQYADGATPAAPGSKDTAEGKDAAAEDAARDVPIPREKPKNQP